MTTPITDSDKQQQSSTLLNTFHKDGYILLPSPLLSPSFISQLHTECLDIFHTVLDWLCVVDAADFAESWRICEGRVVPFPQRQHRSSAAEYDDDDNLNDSDDGGNKNNNDYNVPGTDAGVFAYDVDENNQLCGFHISDHVTYIHIFILSYQKETRN